MKRFFAIAFLVSIGVGVCSMYVTRTETFDEMVKRMTKGSIPVVKSSELQKWMKEKTLILLDTREPAEFKVSHIKGAVHAGYENFNEHILKEKTQSSIVVCYCSVGYRSEKIGERIKKMGFKNVYNLYGGIFDWINTSNEVVNQSGKVTKKIHPYNADWGKWLTKGIKSYE